MHYAVPKILQQAGRLEKFYTDFSATHGWPMLLNLIPRSLRRESVKRLLARTPQGLDPKRIVAFNDFGIEYAKRRNEMGQQGRFLVHLWAGREFCRRILKRGLGGAGGVYTFNSAGLEVLQDAKRLGLRAVTEQTIAPMRVELELLEDEAGRFPQWQLPRKSDGALDYCEREEEEWQLADIILCGSDFVRDSIRKAGGPSQKCIVVPYGIDRVRQTEENGSGPVSLSRPLRVLFVGTIGLRKGCPYVVRAAKRMAHHTHFRLVGPIGITQEAAAKLRNYVELTGPISRDEVDKHFGWADVFLLPSLCEGSATVIYEALARGLPCICTPNSGSVVRDGIEGFIVAVRDEEAIVDRLGAFIMRPGMLQEMSLHARARATDFTIAKYGKRLLSALNRSCFN